MSFTVDRDLYAKVDTQAMVHKTDKPQSQPTSRVDIQHQPDGWNGWKAHWIEEFDDEFSSYRFAWA